MNTFDVGSDVTDGSIQHSTHNEKIPTHVQSIIAIVQKYNIIIKEKRSRRRRRIVNRQTQQKKGNDDIDVPFPWNSMEGKHIT